MTDAKSASRRRVGCAAVLVSVVTLLAASCSSGHSGTAPPSASPATIADALTAAKRGVEAAETIDCSRITAWKKRALQATTGSAAHAVATRLAAYRRNPAGCDGKQTVVVLRTALTGFSGRSARVVQVSRVNRTGQHGVHGTFASQSDVALVGGRWLLAVESDSRAPLSADLSWATADVRAAVKAADTEVAAIYRLSTEDFPASAAAAAKGLTGAALTTFRKNGAASLRALRKSRAVATDGRVTALGVETSRHPAVVLLVGVAIATRVLGTTGIPVRRAALEVTMAKVHGRWLVATYGTPAT